MLFKREITETRFTCNAEGIMKNRHRIKYFVFLGLLCVVPSFCSIQLYYLKYCKDTVAVIIPVCTQELDATFFLPKGEYVLSVLSGDPSKLSGEEIKGKIAVTSENTDSFSLYYTKHELDWIYENHDRTPQRASIRRNMRYPWTHHIKGYYLVDLAGYFSVPDSFHITKLNASFESLPEEIYLKIETFMEIP